MQIEQVDIQKDILTYAYSNLEKRVDISGAYTALHDAQTIHVAMSSKELGLATITLPLLIGVTVAKSEIDEPVPTYAYISEKFTGLFDGLTKLPSIQGVIYTAPLQGLQVAKDAGRYERQKNMIVDFEKRPQGAVPTAQPLRRNQLTSELKHALYAALVRYDSETYGPYRFSRFIEDAMGLSPNRLDYKEVQARLPLKDGLPTHDVQVLFGLPLDDDPFQIITIMQSGREKTKFPLDKWITLYKKILQTNPQYRLRVLWDKQNTNSPYSLQDLQQTLQTEGLDKHLSIISGTLPNIAAYANHLAKIDHADTFIGSDTGPSHLLLALPNEFSGITLHVPDGGNGAKYWQSSFARQYQITHPVEVSAISPEFVHDTFFHVVNTQ